MMFRDRNAEGLFVPQIHYIAVPPRWQTRVISNRNEQKDASPDSQPDQRPEGTKNAKKSHALDILQQDVEIQGGAAPEIQCVRLQKDLSGPSSLVVQQREEFPFRVELGGSA